MTLVSGSRFGPYEIAGEIGAGGMGVVYRATDTKLARKVAIKVLPQSMASDTERLARFDREAKTLASLNHPNIAQIYGLEESGGTTALILELVEGPTLEDRIEEGALPVDEALEIAMQIANALEAAHGQGIVHRDLKPANIKLRSDGTVKVLDFGIAKALDIRAVSGALSPVMTTPAMTETGIILGTAGYMSPEQARGKGVDERTDIWAFGCLLYEMLTGQPAFGGEDVTVTLARILERDPDMSSLPSAVSPAVRKSIQVCLEKDVRRRVADIRDVRLALEGVFETVSPPEDGAVAAQALWRRALPAAAAVLLTGVIVGSAAWLGTRPQPQPVNRFALEQPWGFRNPGQPQLTLSPDGRHFVYNSGGLYLRMMGELEARLIPGTEEEARAPFFSPDGQSLGFYNLDEEQLLRVSISGGTPVVIAEGVAYPSGLSWEADGTILIGQPDGIYRVPATAGALERVIAIEDEFIYGPRLLPDGNHVLFAVNDTLDWDSARIVVQSLTTDERTVLVEGGSDARYLPTGHLVYALGDGLFAVQFDPDTLTVSGGVTPLLQGVVRSLFNQTGVANYSVSDDGTLVYVTGTFTEPVRTLVWVDRDGGEEPIGAPRRAYAWPRISPDGTKVAVSARDEEYDIWIWDFTRETFTRLTSDLERTQFPVWSSDSLHIVYSSERLDRFADGYNVLLQQAADGSGDAEELARIRGHLFPTSILPDALGILVFMNTEYTGGDIGVSRMDGDGSTTPLLNGAFGEYAPQLSPDGRWLAYVSNESGAHEVYVRPFQDVDAGRWQVSAAGGGTQPMWSRDGGELFYRNGEALMAVAVDTTDTTFEQGNPTVVFEDRYMVDSDGPRFPMAADIIAHYDISPIDGRFLMIKEIEEASEVVRIIVVQNWFEDVRRLAPPSEGE